MVQEFDLGSSYRENMKDRSWMMNDNLSGLKEKASGPCAKDWNLNHLDTGSSGPASKRPHGYNRKYQSLKRSTMDHFPKRVLAVTVRSSLGDVTNKVNLHYDSGVKPVTR